MALLYIDGFETTFAPWSTGGQYPGYVAAAAQRRSGYRGGKFTSGTAQAFIRIAYPDGTYPTRVTFGLAHRRDEYSGGWGTTGPIVLIDQYGSRLLALWHNYYGSLRCTLENSNRTLFYTSKTWVREGVWHFVEVDYLQGAEGRVELRINGQVEGLYEGRIDGSPVGYFQGGGIFSADDLYIADDGVFRGDCAVDMLVPAGTTAQNDFTPVPAGPNYSCVDETESDNDTTYIQSSTPGHKDLYTLTSTEFDGSIFGVQVVYNARKSTAGPRSVRSVLKSGGITESGSAAYPSYPDWQYKWDVWTEKPGAGSWTYADVNALEVGAEVVE